MYLDYRYDNQTLSPNIYLASPIQLSPSPLLCVLFYASATLLIDSRTKYEYQLSFYNLIMHGIDLKFIEVENFWHFYSFLSHISNSIQLSSWNFVVICNGKIPTKMENFLMEFPQCALNFIRLNFHTISFKRSNQWMALLYLFPFSIDFSTFLN